VNWKQKIFGCLALGLFFASVLFAPWKVSHDDYNYPRGDIVSQIRYQPVFDMPGSSPQEKIYSATLVWQPLVCTWLAIAVAYGSLFFLCATKKSQTPPKQSDHERK